MEKTTRYEKEMPKTEKPTQQGYQRTEERPMEKTAKTDTREGSQKREQGYERTKQGA